MSTGAPIRYDRQPNEPFEDDRAEVYARCRASNTPVRASAKEAGISTSTAAAMEKHAAVKMRVAELRANQRRFTGITLAAVMQKFWENAQNAAEVGNYGASNQALRELVDLVKEDAARSGLGQHMAQIGMSRGEKAITEGRRNALRLTVQAENTEPVEVAVDGDDETPGLPD